MLPLRTNKGFLLCFSFKWSILLWILKMNMWLSQNYWHTHNCTHTNIRTHPWGFLSNFTSTVSLTWENPRVRSEVDSIAAAQKKGKSNHTHTHTLWVGLHRTGCCNTFVVISKSFFQFCLILSTFGYILT